MSAHGGENGDVDAVKIDPAATGTRVEEEGWKDLETNHGELKSPGKISSVEREKERERETEKKYKGVKRRGKVSNT